MAHAKKNHELDFIVVGAGLTGLMISYGLKKMGFQVSLLETSDTSGGFNRGIEYDIGTFNNGLRFLPNTEETQQALAFVSDILDMKLELNPQSEPVSTFESGSFKPFVGFGDSSPPFVEELQYFIQESFLKVFPDVYQWTKVLQERLENEIQYRSMVTKFLCEEKMVKSCMVNSSKELKAKNYIFTGPPKDLLGLLPADEINGRTKQKLAKNQYWTALCLDLLYRRRITESQGVFVLNGTTQDEIGPCAGLFQRAEGAEDAQLSQWVSFLDQDDADDEENIAVALKKMKRQIKRAFPESANELQSERILVVPFYAGAGGLSFKEAPVWSSLSNLWIASPQVSPGKNLLSSLQQVEAVLKSIQSRAQEHTSHETSGEAPLEPS